MLILSVSKIPKRTFMISNLIVILKESSTDFKSFQNMLTFVQWKGRCSFLNDRIFFLPTDRLYKGRLLTELPTFEELSNPMKFSFKFARNSRSGGRHLGELLAAWWWVCDVNELNPSMAERLNHSTLLFSSLRIVFSLFMTSCAAPKWRNKKLWVI